MKQIRLICILTALCAAVAMGVQAATVKCTVESVTGSTVVLDCGPKAGTIETGDKVMIKTNPAANKPMDGC